MSRRPPNPAAERAAQNQQTLKNLLKLEPNKVCADCKRNKHPRWASWNLGVFICIRCSGIHRGMGTHISRVKSVDLDSWTDEQLQSILNWGNARANKYWEAKLPPGHIPSEAKIENFIRTKYELKRWVMDGPMPDPSTLDAEGDDDVPLSVVKEKHNIDRRETLRKASIGKTAAPQVDLIGTDPVPPPAKAPAPALAPARANVTGPAGIQVAPKSEPAPPKTTTSSAKDSLLGLDFLDSQPAVPPRPASTTGTASTGGKSRPDLKQSILSLYATAPRPQPQPAAQPASHSSFGSVSGLSSPAMTQTQSSLAGLNDAFSSLSFNASPSPKPAQTDAFASLASFASTKPTTQTSNSSAFSGLSGGSFFDPKPASTHQAKTSTSSTSGWSSLTSAAPSSSTTSKPAPPSAALGDLFDFSSSPPKTSAPILQPSLSSPTMTSTSTGSVFNLSNNKPKPATTTTTTTATTTTTSTTTATSTLGSFNTLSTSNWSDANVWSDANAWATPDKPEPEPKPATATTTTTTTKSTLDDWSSFASQPIVPSASGGFAPAPKVAADEEFGGWTSSTGTSSSKPVGGFAGADDLFSNVWQ
ncbi:ARF GTPase activator-like protein [Thermochaetoides thermophila DSM 1495]|uniref:ARF GTPase activator-like protein n=1 Tax=Chaetomium thermophilum (strain DSM 1495 / CBS 144.50 / IMI 039719) TaxID=759272 RepID=G0S912_CHATD|nr:ARF GTPase activator-like protein [Thermochaetoides thermophila DSM 1495]EGS19923.1 ARF GTPase activator-like protein [Thermochaetoides thermophila DSM 1495]